MIDAAERHMEVIVDDTQLSLAIGKKGQNVRLAAKLLGAPVADTARTPTTDRPPTGAPVLALSWVPLLGDALCVAAGWLRLPWWPCLLWLSLGKTARYAVLVWLAKGV